MKRLLRLLRSVFLWAGPVVVLFLAVLTGFSYWVVASQPGTRWALETGVGLAGGKVEAVQGTIWGGLQVGELEIKTPAVNVSLADIDLLVDWPALRDRRLHARNVSAGRLSLDVLESDDPAPRETPFEFPSLPVTLALDRVSLGELNVSLNNEPVLVKVKNLEASLALTEKDAQLVFRRVSFGQQDIEADVTGEFRLLALAEPWPFSMVIETQAKSSVADSVLCARHFLPDLPQAKASDQKPTTELDALSTFCAVDLKVQAEGSMDEATLHLEGSGQDMTLQATARLAPRQAFPLRQADFSLALTDGSSASGQLAWSEQPEKSVDHVKGQVVVKRLDLGWLAGEGFPQALLNSTILFDAQLKDHTHFQAANLNLVVNQGSSWNGKPLAADVVLDVRQAEPVVAQDPGFRADQLRIDLRLGDNRINGSGRIGWSDTELQLAVKALRLADFWPGIDGGLTADVALNGAMAAHNLNIKAVYDLGKAGGKTLGDAPVTLTTRVEGGYQAQPDLASAPGVWSGRVVTLDVEHAGVVVKALQAVPLLLTPGAQEADHLLQVGATRIGLALPSRNDVVVDHTRSTFSPGRWSTQGKIDRLTVSSRIIDEVTEMLDTVNPDSAPDRGKVVLDVDDRNDLVEIYYGAKWDLAFAGALSGTAQVRHLGGDMIIPGDPPAPLGLRTLQADLKAQPNGNGASRLDLDINIDTVKMGRATIEIDTLLRATPEGGLYISANDTTTLSVKADVADLSWLSLFVGDATTIGGSLTANLQARSSPDGTWRTTGTIAGEDIRFVRIDDGVRLIEGTLRAHMEGDRVILDSLSFPARRRAIPKEWRTEEWTRANPDAQGGSLKLSGYWDISELGGKIDVDLYRYPILQRSDRFAMVTGKLNIDAPSEKLDIKGKVTVDAGWVDLDMLSSVPTVDSDVVVVRRGQAPAPKSTPMDIGLDIEVDLGPRFYITGYGVDSGLVGQMQIVMAQGKISALGALRTRGGAISAYGQRLQLRRGTITFQGDIASPVINIEAVRTGVAVEAGVRVSGTARRPQIDLISYPEVSDVQKLSWLLLGRGPDDSGGDAALLFSVGTSFLGDGEPFYKKFGLDEVSMRSGELGSVGSILPAESVVRGLDSGTSDIERQFMVAAKHLANGFTVSLEQSLSGTGTVGRVSYRLARGLSARLSAGTVNGLALIYRYVSRE